MTGYTPDRTVDLLFLLHRGCWGVGAAVEVDGAAKGHRLEEEDGDEVVAAGEEDSTALWCISTKRQEDNKNIKGWMTS